VPCIDVEEDRQGDNVEVTVQLVPLFTNKVISLIRRGRLYSSCVRSSMLHRSETWPVRKENEVALERAELRMVRWMCDVKVKDKSFK